jgi:CRP-like cAMP-binding protein
MDLSILRELPLVSLPAQSVVIEQGKPLDGLYFLEIGEVEVLKDGFVIGEVFDPGAVFGEMSWLLRTEPTATVRTLAPSTFRHVPDPATFLPAHPDVLVHMATILARRIDALAGYVVDIKHQFRDHADHLGIMDEVLDALMHKHPRQIARRDAGD